ncbi:arylsulfatase [Prosthecobacter vanneervenii]|uniref:Arylsulfatase n=1 Tax=Prosthecobacter vanneervenii TaxID=48466 RepID=A0A7W7Y8C9_9BACT|nr:arylsulfatase [Prosthecobacter vanneervenii]MBB5031513.1 arylsulfatase [Prosthecobacter vanneervenii]
MPSRFHILLTSFALTASTLSAAQPNIILIMSDDMGFSDIGCYGGEIETPNLDRLAKGGVRLSQFYNTGRCCPTRASLLTGLYPHQAGIGHMMEDRGQEGYRGDLSARSRTIAEVLRPAGYRTYGVGKWHVTKHAVPEGPKHNWPLHRGFDRFYGTITGAGSFYDPGTLTRDDAMISPFADAEYQPKQYYYTDAISDHAVRYIGEHARDHAQQPFFMYMAYTAAHWPMHALPEDVKKYHGRYDAGYESVRQARLLRLKKAGLVAADAGLSPTKGDWSQVKDRAWETRCMEVFAAMIDRMDQGIGRVLAELEKHGQLDNTLIFFLQDNGGCQEPIGRQATPPKFNTQTFPVIAQDAIRLDVIPKQTRDGQPVRQGQGITPGGPNDYIAYGEAWANVSNTPHREYKHFVHEGGISTPLIAYWPAGLPEAQRGRIESQPGHLIDIMATCVDVAGAKYPAEVEGRSIQPLEGVSLMPVLQKSAHDDTRSIFWEHEGNRAHRMGPWKLVAKEDQPWELYDISKDRAEQHDLASEEPDRVRSMAAAWDAWAARAQVLPLGSWKRPDVNAKGARKKGAAKKAEAK